MGLGYPKLHKGLGRLYKDFRKALYVGVCGLVQTGSMGFISVIWKDYRTECSAIWASLLLWYCYVLGFLKEASAQVIFRNVKAGQAPGFRV